MHPCRTANALTTDGRHDEGMSDLAEDYKACKTMVYVSFATIDVEFEADVCVSGQRCVRRASPTRTENE